ncbi:dehydrogenase [Sphingomonas sp. Root710]|uniref:SDR family NAD(P)-dependent oxidoreductase n=1 Tax=Sphingomonas sp. Root710 TaxID=1736594 RepID=UPI0006F80996|nr:glucose 1-dehydrogenase [Sphingomonas sp. Root710]KRB85484.1 dehydrogenase [Sphingomonas sp. Root710]
MAKLEGACAVVTGAGRGIGFAVARRLAEEGAKVVISDVRGQEEAADMLAGAGHDVIAVQGDVTSEVSVDTLVDGVMSRFGHIDILVNNAAVAAELKPQPFEELIATDWHRIYDVNVVGIFRMCRAVSPHMRAAGAGRIINIASGAAFKATSGLMHYVASKGAVIAMTRSLASELAEDNILVNAIAPGFTLSERVQASPDLVDAFGKVAVSSRLLKRHELPADIANVVFFLAGPDASFITGQVLAADGGSVFH